MLDAGCAFGFGTSVLAGAPAVQWIAGVEYDPDYAATATSRYSQLPIARANVAALPLADGSVDTVVLLDVLEHLDEPAAAVAEARRVLRPDGQLVLSVPHHGALAALDSLNVYAALRRRWPHLPPLEASEQTPGGTHRHFSVDEMRGLLRPAFQVERTAITGLGIAELVHLAVLLVCRGLLRWEAGYLALRYLYFTAYLVEDALPAGRWGYHLTVRARVTPGQVALALHRPV